MHTVRFGIIGLGMMGREFASAAARWCHLPDMEVRPEIVSICSKTLNEKNVAWYTGNFPSIKQVTGDYREVIANPDVDVAFIAVPHNLHEEMYIAALEGGKHLIGEKPFGIDKAANDSILGAIARHLDLFVRCTSHFIFYPAVQEICCMIENDEFGEIIEVEAGFLHSSDLDPGKPINWKRILEFNGEYGCMGDLGMHVLHVPFRAGWTPRNVRAILSNIIKERPDGKGGTVPCKTWDNATLLCQTELSGGESFPMTVKTHRIAPGEMNSWYLSILGTKRSARFSTKNPKLLQVLDYTGGKQAWQHIDTGQKSAFKTISGGIFTVSFSDALLQMWAAFLYELTTGEPLSRFTGCVTPAETALSHRLFRAALESEKNGTVVEV